jgi:hypothetical protein
MRIRKVTAIAAPALLVTALGGLAAAYPAVSPAAAATARPPAGRTVTFDGVSLRVPAAWPVVSLSRHPRACPRLNVHAVYLGTPGPDPVCPANLQGKTGAVLVQPVDTDGPDRRQATRRTVIGGRPAWTNTDAAVTHTIIDILPSAGIEISLSYGRSPAVVRSVQSSVRMTGQARAISLATPAAITPAAAQGVDRGPGFDTCAAPSAGAMRSWLASPYRAIGIYIGGVNRACAQASLTPGWIRSIQREGWRYFPLYVGLQASCVAASGDETINAPDAAAEGTAAAQDAVTQARDLGIPAATPIIYDMEGYSGGCGPEVTTFLSAWDSELHTLGYVAGVYESFSNVPDLVSAAGQITEPDVIHYADWDGRATTGSSYMPANMWTDNQRIHQYQGGNDETYGGVTLNVDNDQLDVALGGGTGLGEWRPAFRMSVAINGNGTAEWFAKTADGTVTHDYQHPVGSLAWWGSTGVGSSPTDLASNPAVTANADGSLTLFARTSGGQVAHAWQQAGAPDGWQWGGAAGAGTLPGTPVADPAAMRAPDGDVTVFVTDSAGAVLTTRQDSPGDNTGWTAWSSLGGSCASSPVPVLDAAKTVEVFCATAAGTLAVETGTGSWQTIGGGPAGVTGTPSAVTTGGGQTEVFTAAKSGQLAYAWQPAGGGWTWGSSPAGSTKIKNSPAAIPWSGGGAAVFAQQANGQLGYATQPAGGAAAWTWTPLSSHLLGSPVAWVNTSGSPEVAILDKRLQVAVSSDVAGRWSSWSQLGGGY